MDEQEGSAADNCGILHSTEKLSRSSDLPKYQGDRQHSYDPRAIDGLYMRDGNPAYRSVSFTQTRRTGLLQPSYALATNPTDDWRDRHMEIRSDLGPIHQASTLQPRATSIGRAAAATAAHVRQSPVEHMTGVHDIYGTEDSQDPAFLFRNNIQRCEGFISALQACLEICKQNNHRDTVALMAGELESLLDTLNNAPDQKQRLRRPNGGPLEIEKGSAPDDSGTRC